MEIKKELTRAIDTVLKELKLGIYVVLERPTDSRHGDYSSNIALVAFRRVKGKGDRGKWKTPIELAQEIAKPLTLNPKPYLDRVEVAPPGFINFWLSEKYLTGELEEIVGKEDFGSSDRLKNKKIMLEFADPNPFKEFHIGHLYSNIVGEALCRLLESQGATVKRVNYQGDVGRHVASSIWGMLKKMKDESLAVEDLEARPLEERVKFMANAYALGTAVYQQDPQVKQEIDEFNRLIYQGSPTIASIYQRGRQWSIDYFETIYSRLGTRFDRYYFESEAGKTGIEIVRSHISDGIFEESDGAVIFPGKKYGLHNRVFINSQGLPTYEAKELGLAPTKYKDFSYDKSIIVTGNEINEYFKVLLKALSLINSNLAAKTKHIGHGMVRLPTGKMSSRTGQVITGEWLLDEVKRRILEAYPEMDTDTAEIVAIGAVKWALLKSSIGKDTAFSFEESINLEGNSGPYLQYTFARTQSVLSKIKNQKSKIKTTTQNLKLEPEEMLLLRVINRFPEIVEEAAESFAPNTLCNYLFDLSQAFNLFYQKHKILTSIGAVRDFRVALTLAIGQTLKTGLYLLGIEAPQRM